MRRQRLHFFPFVRLSRLEPPFVYVKCLPKYRSGLWRSRCPYRIQSAPPLDPVRCPIFLACFFRWLWLSSQISAPLAQIPLPPELLLPFQTPQMSIFLFRLTITPCDHSPSIRLDRHRGEQAVLPFPFRLPSSPFALIHPSPRPSLQGFPFWTRVQAHARYSPFG